MTWFMHEIHQENKVALELAFIGSLFAVPVGASSALMFGLMTGRSNETDLVLAATGGLLAALVTFIPLYLHELARRG